MSNRREKKVVKVMVFGTFDGLHPGHLNFFKQARRLASGNFQGKPFLIASIARDKNVKKIKIHTPQLKEKKRLILVKKCKLVDRAVLGGVRDPYPHILKEKPDIIALGYDQKAYVKNLKKDLKNKGFSVKIIRLKPFKAKIFKSHLLK